MRSPENVLNTLSKHSNVSDYKFERLYRLLFNEEMFYVAYQRIYAKQGNMTAGTDGKTADQMTLKRIACVIASLKDETYQPKPARRTYIPKKNGKMRPLGIPSFEDKLVQEVVRMILEAVYEGSFEHTSHGFRPNRSCHTALLGIQKSFTGTKWFIEGDIKGFFDNIDHNVLISILSERIADERFLRLIRKFLNAGYMEKWEYHKTYSGTPQGGIISPILANIYLDKFDKYMKEYAQGFDKGDKRRRTKEICRLNGRIHYLTRRCSEVSDKSRIAAMKAEIQTLHEEAFRTASADPMDEGFRRLKYQRYADDFLIGVIGTKAECEKIKADITAYMRDKLKLELSAEKTLITNAQEPARFLGYEIYTRKDNATKRNSNGVRRRYFNGNIILHMPSEVVRKKLIEYDVVTFKQKNGKETWDSKARTTLVGRPEEDILARFNQEIRGFYNYYSIANNASAVGHSFAGIMKFSMFKTLAQKLNCSVRTITNRYRKDKDFVIPYKDAKGNQKYRILYNGGFKRRTEAGYATFDILPHTFAVPYPSLVERLREGRCELCGTEGEVLMHQVRNLTTLKGDTEWEKVMLKRRRKTLVVCQHCNEMIHAK